ncbi:TlpA family protein disulfide reductase [Campylobacter sp. MG1]|uniref:TlpA family protein disulfide reductase n=1 Tax=Campylobacter sp. MG1 TaxID=2976332 RepID=UPI00226CDCDC|nr:TlpA disulfide reductase family protein [Campylobacter sp. MG1]
MKVKIIFLCFVLALFVACGDDKKDNETNNNEKDEKVIKKDDFNYLVKFSLNFHNSDRVFELKRKSEDNKDLEFNSNKIILFNFFTTWCPPCIAEIYHLNNLVKKYGDRLEVIGVLLEDKSNEELEQFIKEHNINYNVAVGDNNYTLVKVLGEINGIPYIALYDQNGKNINNYLGAVYEEMLDIDIQKVMK